MTREQTEKHRAQLLNLLQRLTGDVQAVAAEALRQTGGEASGSLSNAPMHLADLGTDNFEQEMAVSLLENQSQILGQVRAALQRIADGKYGRCQECGRDIPTARLDAIPYTPYCVHDAARIEQEEGQAPTSRL
jgi:RNA polymerase-binding transcription factor DksA